MIKYNKLSLSGCSIFRRQRATQAALCELFINNRLRLRNQFDPYFILLVYKIKDGDSVTTIFLWLEFKSNAN